VSFLEVREVTKYFGGVAAVSEMDLSLREGEIFGLLGPNGAGKTTLFNCIAGYHRVDKGSIVFKGKDITSMPPYTVCRSGISRTFQLVKVFLNMTVLENVMVSSFFHNSSAKKARKIALDVLEFVGLSEHQYVPAANLTLVNKKLLDLASALALQPKLLMLDEVMSGLTPTEINKSVDLLLKIRSTGITIFLIEHVMEAVMPLCDRIVVLDQGKKIGEDIPENIVKNDRVITAYLGVNYNAKSQ